MDNATLLFLLKGGHLSMPDRIERGLWPHAPLSFKVVADYLASVLEQSDDCFPRPRMPHLAGEPVQEGGTIERQGNSRYIYRSSAAHPISPTTLNRSVETVFTTARDAAVHYLKWDLNLPGDLDGWKVVNDE
jgi:hypothetical protein